MSFLKDLGKLAGPALIIVGTLTANPYLVAAGITLQTAQSLQAAQVAKARARAARDEASAIKGNLAGGDNKHLLVFGKRRVGGLLMTTGTSGNKNQFLNIFLAHSITNPGGIEGLSAVYFNEDKYALTPTDVTVNTGTGTATRTLAASVTTGEAANLASIRTYTGLHTQVIGADLVSQAFAATGDDAKGVCWSWIQLFNDVSKSEQVQRAFGGGIPLITVEISGNKVYDPRQDSTNGGSGSQRYGSPLTWTYSANSALVAATYMVMRQLDGGCGIDPTNIVWSDVITAANICDQTLPNAAGAKYYACNIALDTGDDCDTNLQLICDTMRGGFYQDAGQYRLWAAAYIAPTVTITDDWLAGPIEVLNGAGLDNLYNAVRVTYPKPDTGYQFSELFPFTNAAYEVEDGNRRLFRDLTLQGVTNDFQAQYLGQIEGRKSRQQKTITLTVNLAGLTLAVNQTVQLNLSNLTEVGTPDVFRIVAREIGGGDQGELVVSLALTEERADIYTPAAFSTPSTAPAINPLYQAPDAPTGLTALGVADGVNLTWSSPSALSHTGIEIEVANAVGGPYSLTARVKGDGYVFGTTVGSLLYFRIRALNAEGQYSAYVGPVNTVSKTVADGADVSSVATASFPFNPGFEAGDKNWARGTGWAISQDANARTGAWCAVFTGGTAAITTGRSVAVAAGEVVRWSAWAKASAGANGTANARINFYNSTGTLLGGGNSANLSPTTTYSLMRLTATAPANTAAAVCDVAVFNRTTGTWYLDDAEGALFPANIDETPDGSLYGRTNNDILTTNRPDLSKPLVNRNLDFISDTGSYRRTRPRRVDTNGDPYADFSESINLNRTAANISETATQRWAAETGANITETRTSADTGAVGGRTSATVRDESRTGYNVTVAGSAQRLGDGRNMPNAVAGATGIFNTVPVSATSAGAVNIAAFDIIIGGVIVSYSAVSNAITGLTQNTYYYIYTDDPTYAGGTRTYAATTSASTSNNSDGRVRLGRVLIPTSGTNFPPGDQNCVAADSYLPDGRQASAVRLGDRFSIFDDAGEPQLVAVTCAVLTLAESVRIVTEAGLALCCSASTPFTLRSGDILFAPDMVGAQVRIVDADGLMDWQTVTAVDPIGRMAVMHISAGGGSFAASEAANGPFIYSHNGTVKP